MKKLYLLTFLPLAAQAQTITPKYYDITPNDGMMDAGSYANPYVVKDDMGQVTATVKPRYFDITPNDGLMDEGTYANPYEVEEHEDYGY